MNWLLLLAALTIVESGGDDKAVGDNGKAFGSLQIHKAVVDDVNRIYRLEYTHKEMYNRSKARNVCALYLRHWGKMYKRETGLDPGYEIYARIWNGGPIGWKKKSTKNHWLKIKRELEKLE